MHPYLFEIFGREIPTWGVIIVSTIVGLIVWGNHLGKKDGGYPKDLAFEFAIITFTCHTIGGRIGYVRANWGRFEGNWKGLFDFSAGGTAFYESFLLIVVALAVYLWWRKIPIGNLFDLAAPLVPVGQGVGRFACVAAGCCYGKPSDLPWALTFNHPRTLAPQGVALHPTQLYEAAVGIALAAFLFWFRPRRTFRGQVALLYMTAFPLLRFVTEFFRGDPKRGWFMEEQLGQVLSKPQGLSLIVLIVVGICWWIVPRLPGARDLSTSGAPRGSTRDEAKDPA
jgi:phosphatidylglycerol---prolipoprotein diacylglyceryl transferase